MDLALSAKDEAFRDDVRRFLDEKLSDDLREAGRLMTSVYSEKDVALKWQRILYEKGWVAPNWPVEYGGTGWSVVQRYIFQSEVAKASAPALSPMGLAMCGPVLIGHGTPEQKDYYLPRILRGDDFWCQGYSEPGAGSDLATLQMSAVEDGDDFICNGTKIWTTQAHYANMMFCLVRTDNSGKPQQGITFLLIDMTSPGVRVEPIVFSSGEAIQCTCFFDDVRVPKSNVVGKVNDGWTVAKYLLQFERGGTYAPGLRVRLGRIRDMAAAEQGGDGGALIDDVDFRRKLDETEIAITALEFTEHRIMSALSQGEPPGPESSMLKTNGTETSQRLTELALEAAQHYIAPFQPDALEPGKNVSPIGPARSITVAAKYLNDRAATIYAGSNEIQRNIMAKAVLGL